MSDDNESATREGRAASLVPVGQGGAKLRLTIDGLTPVGQAIEVMTYSWGGQAPPEGAPQFGDLVIRKTMDETSPRLFEALATARSFTTATMKLYTLVDGGAASVNYAMFTLEQVRVARLDSSGNAEAETLPTEEVAISYDRIRQETRMPDANGNLGPSVRFAWDVVLRRPWA